MRLKSFTGVRREFERRTEKDVMDSSVRVHAFWLMACVYIHIIDIYAFFLGGGKVSNTTAIQAACVKKELVSWKQWRAVRTK